MNDDNRDYPVTGSGLGLRRSMLGELAAGVPASVDFFEVAPENWIAVGGRLGRGGGPAEGPPRPGPRRDRARGRCLRWREGDEAQKT